MIGYDFPSILRERGLRATSGRLALLDALANEQYPVTVEHLQSKMRVQQDLATLYRALDALVESQIVTRVDLQHGHAHFELLIGRPHHHHVICRSCSTIENIEVPHERRPEQTALQRAKRFASIDTYTLDFFGLCNRCAT